MAWVRFSSCVETVSNSSSTVEEEKGSGGPEVGDLGTRRCARSWAHPDPQSRARAELH